MDIISLFPSLGTLWLVFSFSWLQVKPLQIFMCRFWYECKFLFWEVKYLEIRLLGHTESIGLWSCTIFHSRWLCVKVPLASLSTLRIVRIFFFYYSYLVNVWPFLIVVLIYIFLMTNDISVQVLICHHVPSLVVKEKKCSSAQKASHTRYEKVFASTLAFVPIGILSFNSVLILPRVSKFSKVKGSVLKQSPSPPHFSYHAQILNAWSTHTLTWLRIRGSHNPLQRFSNLPQWLTEFRKTLTYIYQFIIKATGKEPEEERHRMRSGRILNFCWQGVGVDHFRGTWVCSATQKLSSPEFQEFLWTQSSGCLSSIEVEKWSWVFQPSSDAVTFLVTCPHTEAIWGVLPAQQSFNGTQKDSQHSGDAKSLTNLCQELGTETK